MIAGRDTTSAALTWFFCLVSMNPVVKTRILEELKENSHKTCETSAGQQEKYRVFDAEELNQSVYLHAALYESLRLYPPVPFEQASVLQPEVLPSGESVRPGTKILIPLYTMARMESKWGKDCLEFKPARWITEKGKLKYSPLFEILFVPGTGSSATCGPVRIQLDLFLKPRVDESKLTTEEDYLGISLSFLDLKCSKRDEQLVQLNSV
ncbi:hypothetical protein AAC387_Pa02g3572 [Persea americana]